jgi:hypothetical protein
MRILLTKISDKRHALEVVRRDGTREGVELVTREFLFHDLLHYAIESSVSTQGGFWGALASGKTLADVNDRSGAAMKGSTESLAGIEVIVGMMTGAVKSDAPVKEVMETIRQCHQGLGRETPVWWNEAFIADVRERMRRLQGHWRATPFKKTMEIVWVD